MPQSKEQGTGKHPHKSAEDPRPHNEAPTTSGRKETSSSKSSSKGEQGTGKHPHKSAEDPRPHNEASTTSGRKEATSTHSNSRSESGPQSSTENDNDLKSREYTGPDGEVHHHTTKYAEQHKGDRKAS